MPSMSYCRFENTARDFLECLNQVGRSLEDGATYQEFIESLSDSEQYWFKRMMTYCSDMQQYVDDLHENRRED